MARGPKKTKVKITGLRGPPVSYKKIKNNIRAFKFIYLLRIQNIPHAFIKKSYARKAFLEKFNADWNCSRGRVFFCPSAILMECLECGANIKGNPNQFFKEFFGERSDCEFGIIVTNEPVETVQELINDHNNHEIKEYAKLQSLAAENVTIPAGIVSFGPEKGGKPVLASMIKFFEIMEIPAIVTNNKICLSEDYSICKIGDYINEKQAHALLVLGYKITIASPKISLTTYYDQTTRQIIKLD